MKSTELVYTEEDRKVILEEETNMAETSLIESASFVEDAKQILDKADACRKEKTRLQGELKQQEKTEASLEKAIADNVSGTLKRKKEEVASSFDERISVCQNRIKDLKAERAKAKADAVSERIRRENSPMENENTQLQQQIDQIYEENGIRSFCKKHLVTVLFFPRKPQDWLTVAGISAAALFLVPLLLILGMSGSPLALAAVLFVYLSCLFGGYLYVLHRYMIEHRHVHLQVEELKASIRENTRKMNAVAANIRKSQDETGYNLGIYDDRIFEVEQQLKEVLEKRRAALEEFEQVTRHRIAEEVTAASQDQKDALKQQREELQQQLDEASKELEDTETDIRDIYEARIGRDLMHRQKLTGLGDFCRENPELSVEQAADCYRKTKK